MSLLERLGIKSRKVRDEDKWLSMEQLKLALARLGLNPEDVLPESKFFYDRTAPDEIRREWVENLQAKFDQTPDKQVELNVSGTYGMMWACGEKVDGIWNPTKPKRIEFSYSEIVEQDSE